MASICIRSYVLFLLWVACCSGFMLAAPGLARLSVRLSAIDSAKEGSSVSQETSSAGAPSRDFYSAEIAAERLVEAQKRYTMAKQRSEQFLAQVQKEYQETIAAQEKEMSALVEDEGRIAQDMESRFTEVKEVRSEVQGLVEELEAVRNTGVGMLFSRFDVIKATGIVLCLDTIYVSYLASVQSDVLIPSIGTELLLGAFFIYKVNARKTQEGEEK